MRKRRTLSEGYKLCIFFSEGYNLYILYFLFSIVHEQIVHEQPFTNNVHEHVVHEQPFTNIRTSFKLALGPVVLEDGTAALGVRMCVHQQAFGTASRISPSR